MDKRGLLGLDTTRVVIVALLTIVVLAIAMFVVLATLRNTAESSETLLTGTKTNESVTGLANLSLNSTGNELSVAGLRNCVVSITEVVNASDGAVVNTANYTEVGCYVWAITNSAYVSRNVKITYSYTYNSPYANEIFGNITVGSGNFFKQIPTVFTLLGVVLIILAIAIVIIGVAKFGMGNVGSRKSLDEL